MSPEPGQDLISKLLAKLKELWDALKKLLGGSKDEPKKGPLDECEDAKGMDAHETGDASVACTDPVSCPLGSGLSKEGRAFIANYEGGYKLDPYDDQTGKPIDAWVKGATIGAGHLISESDWPKYKGGITQDEADELYAVDLQWFEQGVKKLVTADLQQYQFDALVSLAYTIGISGFANSDVLRLINDSKGKPDPKDLESAWKAPRVTTSQGKINQGLVNRRMDEWELYTKGDYTRDH
jgi:type VI secretion system secreted protein VgrG